MVTLRSMLFAVLLSAGCVPVQSMTLTKPASTTANDVAVEVRTVAASSSFLLQRGGHGAIFAATIAASSRATTVLETDRATLVLVDPGGEEPDVVLPVTSGGPGTAPEAILPNQPPGAVPVRPGEGAIFWVAFKSEARLREADVPRRIVLRIPVTGGGPPVEVLLAEPATGRPRWELRPVANASYGGISASGTFDEASFGIVRASGKNVAGPFVMGPSFSLGFRGGKLRYEQERTSVACCDLGVAFDLSAPMLRGPEGAFGPYLGYQALFVLDERADTAPWHGPSAGLQFFSRPIETRRAGALPVRQGRTPLGYVATTIAYVHWLRRGDPTGSPGFVLNLEHTLPEP